MKRKLLLILSLLMVVSCRSLSDEEDMANRVFLYHLSVIESFVNIGYIDEVSALARSYEFLEGITGIKGDVEEQKELFYTPSKENLRDWKRWLRNNRQKIYWDAGEQKVKIKA